MSRIGYSHVYDSLNEFIFNDISKKLNSNIIRKTSNRVNSDVLIRVEVDVRILVNDNVISQVRYRTLIDIIE